MGKRYLLYPLLTCLARPAFYLIEQANYQASQYAKKSQGKWFLTEYDAPDNFLKLESIYFQTALYDIYLGVNFDLNYAQ